MRPPHGRFTALSLAVTVAFAAGGCGQGTLDSKAVRTQAEMVASISSEGAILGDQLARKRIKESFVQVEAADLAERAAKSEQELDPALSTPELKHTVERLGLLAEDASVQLRGIETDPRSERRIDGIAERLGELRDAASRVEDEL